jgi:hypothetical protein
MEIDLDISLQSTLRVQKLSAKRELPPIVVPRTVERCESRE